MIQIHISPLLCFLVTIHPRVQAWTFSTTNVNLAAPPPLRSDYVTENDAWVGNHGQNDPGFPCDAISIPPDVHRTPFPIDGGRLTWSLTNNTVGSLSDSQYIADGYVGQISLGDGTYTNSSQRPDGMNFGYWGSTNQVFQDFKTGSECGYPMNMSSVISNALGKTVGAVDSPVEGIEGMNVTIGLRIVLFTPPPDWTEPYDPPVDYNMEEMIQCAYVTLTSADVSRFPDAGSCNGYKAGEVVPAPSGSIGPSTTAATSGIGPNTLFTSIIAPSNIPTSTLMPSGGPIVAAGSSTHSRVAIGTGVGISMAASLAAVIFAFWFIRRRRARKTSGTVGADIMISRPLDRDDVKAEKGGKEKVKETVAESSSNSVHSEPLPVYTESELVSDRK